MHTDDIAWHHSFFGWMDVMIEGVLEPVHRGEPSRSGRAAWVDREREGCVAVPRGVRAR